VGAAPYRCHRTGENVQKLRRKGASADFALRDSLDCSLNETDRRSGTPKRVRATCKRCGDGGVNYLSRETNLGRSSDLRGTAHRARVGRGDLAFRPGNRDRASPVRNDLRNGRCPRMTGPEALFQSDQG
jgi:hypothetical protein